MDRDFLDKNWKFLEAFKDGKNVQYKFQEGQTWYDCDSCFEFNYNHEYRLAPEHIKLKAGDKIKDQHYNRIYTMLFLKVENNNYLVPVRLNEEGSIVRLIEPIKCTENYNINLEEVQSRISSTASIFVKV